MPSLISEYNKLKPFDQNQWQLFLDSKTKKQQSILKAIRKFESVKQVTAILSSAYPVFDINNPKPLKIDIRQDIQVEGVSHRQIKLALQYYTGSRQYLKALIESEYRYNLDGTIASPINQESKDDAKARLLKKTSKDK